MNVEGCRRATLADSVYFIRVLAIGRAHRSHLKPVVEKTGGVLRGVGRSHDHQRVAEIDKVSVGKISITSSTHAASAVLELRLIAAAWALAAGLKLTVPYLKFP